MPGWIVFFRKVDCLIDSVDAKHKRGKNGHLCDRKSYKAESSVDADLDHSSCV